MASKHATDLTVRTVTVFISSDHCRDPEIFTQALATACSKVNTVREALIASDIPVQTVRVALPTPSVFLTRDAAIHAAIELDNAPVDFASLGTVHPTDDKTFLDPSFFSQVITATSTVFLTITTTSENGQPDIPAIKVAAQTISRLADKQSSGIANMRFSALANVRPGCPFFPASYASSTISDSGPFPISIGVQTAPMLYEEPLSQLPARIEKAAKTLVDICRDFHHVTCDFSTAPLPGWRTSAAAPIARIAGADERRFGCPGTLGAAASVATLLARANFPRAGLCGIMLPPAEDSALAECETPLRLSDLLMTSAVCGTGLDMVPLPGDTPVAVLQRIIGDVTALSARLGRKQLTARLLPIPGKKAGDMTEFDSPYLVRGPVMQVDVGMETDCQIGELFVDPLLR